METQPGGPAIRGGSESPHQTAFELPQRKPSGAEMSAPTLEIQEQN